MLIKKIDSFILLPSFLLISVMLIISCTRNAEGGDPNPDFPPVDRGTIEANRALLTFTERDNTTQSRTFEYYDPDGIGGNSATIIDTLKLKRPTPGISRRWYLSEIQLFQDNELKNQNIAVLEKNYMICYRGQNPRNLELESMTLDQGGFTLGLGSTWFTEDESGISNPSDGTGSIRVTMNFQKQAKNGLCDPGVRIFEAVFPYVVE
ncbi:MAG: hypothetical protein CMO34_05730 [Verrucomicrobia bacterium]|nr:hypothetical protein [Verrucomicrobiota bacterium]